MADYGIALFPRHAALLTASVITPEHARARGYRSVDTKALLESIGVTKAGRNVPGLLVPMLRKDGSTWGFQYRPDVPRERDEKPVKYETPTKQRNGIDVPPGVGPALDDPAVPLWVTEGVKKADAAACVGLACIALPGVWSWRGTNPSGGKVAVADWHDIALNGRRVVLAFDSDVVVKPPVRRALDELAGYLASKGATIEYCHLPELVNGKTGLDDYLAGHVVASLWALVRPESPEVKPQTAAAPQPVPVAPLPAMAIAPENGAALLEEVRAAVTRYVVLPSAHAVIAVVLWIVVTHALPVFEHATRLAIHSAVKRCGKSRLLEVIEALVWYPIPTTDISVAALFRVIDKAGNQPPTLILDEADALFGSVRKDEDNRDKIALLNNGFRAGKPTWRCVGPQQIPTPFSNYAMAAIAGIGRKPDTIEDRAVNVTMRRRLPGERVMKLRLRTDLPELHALRDRIAAWVAAHLGELSNPPDGLPDELEDRQQDAWEPLLAVAAVAGGDWPALARDAAVKLSREAAEDDSESLEIRLLHDVRSVFESMPNVGFLGSKVLLTELRRIDDAPWSELDFTSRKLALRIGKFSVQPRHNSAKTERGYHLEDLYDAFRRYIRPTRPEPSDTPSDLGKHTGRVTDGSDTYPSDPSNPSATRPDETAGQTPNGRFRTVPDGTPGGHDGGPLFQDPPAVVQP